MALSFQAEFLSRNGSQGCSGSVRTRLENLESKYLQTRLSNHKTTEKRAQLTKRESFQVIQRHADLTDRRGKFKFELLRSANLILKFEARSVWIELLWTGWESFFRFSRLNRFSVRLKFQLKGAQKSTWVYRRSCRAINEPLTLIQRHVCSLAGWSALIKGRQTRVVYT